MKINLDKNATMPYRAHPFDAGADLYALNGGMILPYGGHAVFDTGVHAQIPESCMGAVKGRSGMGAVKGRSGMGAVKGRSGMAFRNQVICHEGTVDYGYTGSIKVLLFNFGEEPYIVKPGDRIAQLVIQPVVLVPFEQVTRLAKTDRGTGGFGSTGR